MPAAACYDFVMPAGGRKEATDMLQAPVQVMLKEQQRKQCAESVDLLPQHVHCKHAAARAGVLHTNTASNESVWMIRKPSEGTQTRLDLKTTLCL
jgi:hypothetical protein